MFRTSMNTPSRVGKAAATFRASSLAESSSVSERAAIGAANKTKRIKMVRYERLDRSMPVIGVLRPAMRGTKTNSTPLSMLPEIIAQPSGTNAGPCSGIAQNLSGR